MALEGIVEGDGYTAGSLDAMGEGYGFRKVRRELGVTAFGVNAVVLPPNYTAGAHYHDEQEELYICLDGELSLEFGTGDAVERHLLGAGDMALVQPQTVRRMGNPGDGDCTYVCIGGRGGYVGRDAHLPEGEDSRTGD